MTKDVLAARETDRALDLWHRLEERRVSGAPVVDDKWHCVGVVSKTDITRALVDQQSLDGSPVNDEPFVRDIMTCFPIALPENATMGQASALLAYEGIHRILIVDERGRLTGILTTLDITRWVAIQCGFVVPPYTQRQRDSLARRGL